MNCGLYIIIYHRTGERKFDIEVCYPTARPPKWTAIKLSTPFHREQTAKKKNHCSKLY